MRIQDWSSGSQLGLTVSPEYVWQCLWTFFTLTMRREVPLAFSGHGAAMLLDILEDTRCLPNKELSGEKVN